MKKLGLLGLMLAVLAAGVFVRGLGRSHRLLLEPAPDLSRANQGGPAGSELTQERADRLRRQMIEDLHSKAETESTGPLVVKRERGTPVDAALRGRLTSRCGAKGYAGAMVLAWGRGPDVERIEELAAALGRLKAPTPFDLSEALRDFGSFGISHADEEGAFSLDLREVIPPLCIFAAKPGFASIRMWVDLEELDQCHLDLEPLFQARLRLQDASGRALRISQAERKMKHVKNPRRRGTMVDPIWAMAGVPVEVLADVARFQAFVFTGGSCGGESDGPWRFEIDAPGFHPGTLEFSAGRVGKPLREPILTLEPDGTEPGLGSVALFPSGLPYGVAPHQLAAKVFLENESTGELKQSFMHLDRGEEAHYIDDLDTGLWRLTAKDSRKLYPIPDQRIQVDAGLAAPAGLDYSGAAFLYAKDPNLAPGIEQPRWLATLTFSEAEQARRREQGHEDYVTTAPGSPTPLPVGPEIWLWFRTDKGRRDAYGGAYEDEVWVAPRAGHVRILD